VIVSASRRCDIPAHYLEWLLARIRAGYCLVRNPFDARRTRRVSLRPDDVECLVLWTRNPAPLAAGMEALDAAGMASIVQVTITGYPRALEPGLPPIEERLDSFRALADRIGPRRLLWRYDPVMVTEGLDSAFHIDQFSRIAASIEGATERVILSLIDEYAFTRKRIEDAGFGGIVFGSERRARDAGSTGAMRPPVETVAPPVETVAPPAEAVAPPEPYASLLPRLADIARDHGMTIQACAEPFDLGPLGIEPGACIDSALIGELFGRQVEPGRDRGQRPYCRCAPSVDIGVYGSCPSGCVYCYANRGRGRLLHPRPGDESLVP